MTCIRGQVILSMNSYHCCTTLPSAVVPVKDGWRGEIQHGKRVWIVLIAMVKVVALDPYAS